VIPYNPGEKTPVAAADNATSKIEPAPAPSAAANAAKPSGGEIVYTVKAGDNLWKIAREHLGSGTPATIAQIKELNRDVLKGGDALKLNMKLKLPAKVVASAD
jgi:nucleoid-associated protein YgaU